MEAGPRARPSHSSSAGPPLLKFALIGLAQTIGALTELGEFGVSRLLGLAPPRAKRFLLTRQRIERSRMPGTGLGQRLFGVIEWSSIRMRHFAAFRPCARSNLASGCTRLVRRQCRELLFGPVA